MTRFFLFLIFMMNWSGAFAAGLYSSLNPCDGLNLGQPTLQTAIREDVMETGSYSIVEGVGLSRFEREIEELVQHLRTLDRHKMIPDEIIKERAWLADLNQQVVQLVKETFPEETKGSFPESHLRYESGPRERAIGNYWHVDGGRIAAILVLRGRGTEFLTSVSPKAFEYGIFQEQLRPAAVTPEGGLNVFAASGVVRVDAARLAAVHRAPNTEEERVILLVRFHSR